MKKLYSDTISNIARMLAVAIIAMSSGGCQSGPFNLGFLGIKSSPHSVDPRVSMTLTPPQSMGSDGKYEWQMEVRKKVSQQLSLDYKVEFYKDGKAVDVQYGQLDFPEMVEGALGRISTTFEADDARVTMTALDTPR